MKVRTFLLLVVLVVVGAFAALNWSTFMARTTLSLGVTVIEAPLGMVMLGLLAFLTASFLLFIFYLQASALLDARRHARETEANRKLVDQAEASRFTELRGFMEAELKRLAVLHAESEEAVQARLDRLDRDLRSAVEESGNTLAAYIGELEDRIEKKTPDAGPCPTS